MTARYIDNRFVGDLLRKSPQTAATISKMVDDPSAKPDSEYSHKELETEYFTPPKDFASRYQATKDALKLFPDLKLAANIYTSLVVSSGDLATNSVVIGCSDTLILPDIKAKLIRVIEKHLSEGYDFVEKLDEVLLEILIGKGSVCRITIPENSLDDYIHGRKPVTQQALESNPELWTGGSLKSLGILGDIQGLPSMEGDDVLFAVPDMKKREKRNRSFDTVELIDNYNCLKLNHLRDSVVDAALEDTIYGSTSYSTESNSDDLLAIHNKQEEESTPDNVLRRRDIFRNANQTEEPVAMIHDEAYATRDSYCRPLRLDIPSEAVIPIITPGKPEESRGCYVMLDDEYNFLTLETSNCKKSAEYGSQLENGQYSKDLSNKMSSMLGIKGKTTENTAQVAFKRFKEVLERDMADRLNSGLYSGTSFQVSENTDIEYLMFLRTLAGRKTKLLYLPAQLVSYYALEYNDEGIGKNAIEDMTELNNMRGALLFTEVLATVKNNLRTTNVNLTLSPNDPDVAKTIKMATAEVMKTRALDLPTKMGSLSQMGDWIQRAGYTFSFEGHPGLPQVKFDFSDQTIERRTGDNGNLIEDIRNQQFNMFGLTPEVVDTGLDINYATTDVANRKFLLKRIRSTRAKFSKFLTAEISHLCRCDPNIQKELMEIIEGVKLKTGDGKIIPTKEIHARFLRSMKVVLPNLEEDEDIKNQTDKYNTYKQALMDALEAWVDEDMFDHELYGDELNEALIALRGQLMGHFLREYQTKNGYFTELGDITTLDSVGDSFLKLGESIPDHIEGVLTTTESFLKGIKTNTKKMNDLMGKIKEYLNSEEEENETPTEDTTQNDETTDEGETDSEDNATIDDSKFDEVENVDEQEKETTPDEDAEPEQDETPDEEEPTKEDPAE